LRISDYLIIGKILGPFGTKGEVKLLPITDDPGRFRTLESLYIKEGSLFQRKRTDGVRFANKYILLKLEGYDSRDEASHLSGNCVYTDREHAAKLDESSYYYADINGCTVKTDQGEIIGEVFDIQNAGSCDVYRVRSGDSSGKEVLIPAIRDVIKRIDVGHIFSRCFPIR
jgi:16S rRNA processing protein RimM